MKKLLTLIGVLFMSLFNPANAEDISPDVSMHSFAPLGSGDTIELSSYKDKVILIVNTASKCGFTGQYEGLEKLYQDYKDRGLMIIGVPSNDFGSQEPGTDEEIADFCQTNYGVSFPMTTKYPVSGDNTHPFYKDAKKILGFGTAPKWNFHKYLINKKGELVDYFHSTTAPDSDRLVKTIERLLVE